VAEAAARLVAATRWLDRDGRMGLSRLGYLGERTGAAVALTAAALMPGRIGAVVAWSGRPDRLAAATLAGVRAPTLLLAGSLDEGAARAGVRALSLLPQARATSVPGTGRLFAEPSALAAAARVMVAWFEQHLAEGRTAAHSA